MAKDYSVFQLISVLIFVTHVTGFESCGSFTNNTMLIDIKPDNPSPINFCYPMGEKVSHNFSDDFQTQYSIVFNMDSCLGQLHHVQKLKYKQNIVKQPFALIVQQGDKCKCNYTLINDNLHLHRETTIWVVNGILLKFKGDESKNQNRYCVHRGHVSSTRNKIHEYHVTGDLENIYHADCGGKRVLNYKIYNVWTKHNHPCGRTGYDMSLTAKGTKVCSSKDLKSSVIEPTCRSTTQLKLKLTRLDQLPSTCGPFGKKIDPQLCHVKCHREGLILIPGGCYSYGRCYFTRGQFVLYILKCPAKLRFDPVKRQCTPGSCLAFNINSKG